MYAKTFYIVLSPLIAYFTYYRPLFIFHFWTQRKSWYGVMLRLIHGCSGEHARLMSRTAFNVIALLNEVLQQDTNYPSISLPSC